MYTSSDWFIIIISINLKEKVKCAEKKSVVNEEHRDMISVRIAIHSNLEILSKENVNREQLY